MADPRELNEVIWFSVRGRRQQMPAIAQFPGFELMRSGIRADDDERQPADDD